MNNMTFMELMNKGGWVMWVMFISSILIFGCFLERLIAFAKIGGGSGSLLERVKQHVRQGQMKEAIALCAQNSRSFIFHALEVGLHAAAFPREEMESIFAMYRMKLQGILNKRLAIFGTFAFIGPLLGLFGTVMGVIRAFSDLALSGSGGPTIVAAGIAEALIATAAGIFVAVSASLMYNFFTSLVRGRVQQYDLLTQEIAILVYTGNSKGR
jgi:biopolymer transport protein ExbB